MSWVSRCVLALEILLALQASAIAATKSTDVEAAYRQLAKLQDGDVIPENMIETFDLRTLAEALVLRLHRQHETELASDDGYSLERGTELGIFVAADRLPLRVRDGFLNQFQTGSSRGRLSSAMRGVVESHLIGLNFDSGEVAPQNAPIHKLRPKFAAIEINDGRFRVARPYLTGEMYGYGTIVILKDDVRKRATWTVGDSNDRFLDTYRDAYFRGTFDQTPNYPADRVSRGNPAQSIEWMKKGLFGTFLRDSIPVPPSGIRVPYYEAEILGPLDFSDVKEVLVTEPSAEHAVLRALAHLSVPVFRGITHRDGTGMLMSFERGARLSNPCVNAVSAGAELAP